MRPRFMMHATMAMLWLLLTGPAVADNENPWIVTDQGSRWSYRATMDIQPKLADGSQLPSQSFEGQGVMQVVAVEPEPGTDGEILKISSKLDWNDPTLPSSDETQLSAIRNGDLYLEGRNDELDALYLPKKPSIDSKLAPRNISTSYGEIVLEGKIQGVQDVVTPAGTFENCLRMIWTGSANPGNPMPNGMTVEQSNVVETIWYAKGVGNVLQVTEEDLLVSGPNGRINMHTRVGMELTGFEAGGQQPASAASAEPAPAAPAPADPQPAQP